MSGALGGNIARSKLVVLRFRRKGGDAADPNGPPEGACQQAIGDRADSASFNLGGVIVEHRSADPKRTRHRLIGASPPGRIPGRVFYMGPGPTRYSMTSVARSIIDGGMASPSALAVLRFTTISNLVGNCTGRSPGFAPRRMRST